MSPRLVTKVQHEDSNSGISSAASIGNSPSSVEPTQLLDPTYNNLGHIVPLVSVNHMDLSAPSSNLLNEQHVEVSNSLVRSQLVQLLHHWNFPLIPNQFAKSPTKVHLLFFHAI